MPETRITSPAEWVELAGEGWNTYVTEIENSISAFRRRLRTSDFGPSLGNIAFVLFTGPIGASTVITGFALDLIDAARELSQDISLAPRRALLSVVDRVIPVPDVLKTRVMRGDEAVRWAVRSLLEFSVDILDLDTPKWFDEFKTVEKVSTIENLSKNFDADEALKAGKKSIFYWVGVMIANLLLQVLSWGVVAGAAVLIFQFHSKESTNEFMRRHCLSQNNPREWIRQRDYQRVKL